MNYYFRCLNLKQNFYNCVYKQYFRGKISRHFIKNHLSLSLNLFLTFIQVVLDLRLQSAIDVHDLVPALVFGERLIFENGRNFFKSISGWTSEFLTAHFPLILKGFIFFYKLSEEFLKLEGYFYLKNDRPVCFRLIQKRDPPLASISRNKVLGVDEGFS